MAVATHMPIEELSVALAIHCKLFGEDTRAALRQLDPTQRAHFQEAATWASSNAKVIKLLKEDPQAVAGGSYALAEARGWFARMLGIGKARGISAPDDDELSRVANELALRQKPVDQAKARRLADLRALVDESLDGA